MLKYFFFTEEMARGAYSRRPRADPGFQSSSPGCWPGRSICQTYSTEDWLQSPDQRTWIRLQRDVDRSRERRAHVPACCVSPILQLSSNYTLANTVTEAPILTKYRTPKNSARISCQMSGNNTNASKKTLLSMAMAATASAEIATTVEDMVEVTVEVVVEAMADIISITTNNLQRQ